MAKLKRTRKNWLCYIDKIQSERKDKFTFIFNYYRSADALDIGTEKDTQNQLNFSNKNRLNQADSNYSMKLPQK